MKVLYFDIGMYHGEVTDYFIEMFNELNIDYRIVGYEPTQSNFNFLLNKYAQYDNVILHNFALSNFTGSNVPLYYAPKNVGNSLHSSKKNVDVLSYEHVNVKAADSVIASEINSYEPDFVIVKINTEGSEYEIYDILVLSGISNRVDVFCGSLGDIYKLTDKTETDINNFLKMLKENNINVLEVTERKKHNLDIIKHSITTIQPKTQTTKESTPRNTQVQQKDETIDDVIEVAKTIIATEPKASSRGKRRKTK